MTYRPAPHRPQASDACGRCGLPAAAHATPAGAAACRIAYRLEQLTADGWTLPAPITRETR